MHDQVGTAETIGREDELAVGAAFVGGELSTRILVIEGSPGVGKTTVWRAALEAAAATGTRTLQARAAEAETPMAHAVLIDLLTGVDIDDLELPEPQRQALDVALLRRDGSGGVASLHAVALAATHVLQRLAEQSPVLVAIDDLQWVDAPTAEALAFAVRRAPPDRVRVLASRRSGIASPIERSVPLDQVRRIALEGLSVGGIRRVLLAQLGLVLPRRPLLQVYELTLGNPLYALEIGRLLASRGVPSIGQDLELPRSLDELLAAKVTSSHGSSLALLAVALGGGLTAAELLQVAPDADVDGAMGDGLLVERGGKLEPGHPLFAASAVGRSRGGERRALHQRLAALATDPIRRARHLAAAATAADSALAASISDGARAALARGAIRAAVELGEEALRLTPRGDPNRDERVVALGKNLVTADERQRLLALLGEELGSLAPGNARAAGHLLGTYVTNSQSTFDEHLETVLREATDPELRARALAAQAIDAANALLRDYDRAEQRAAEAIRISPGGVSLHEGAHGMAWARMMQGRPIDDLRVRLGDDDHPDFAYSLARVEVIGRLFRGEVDYARERFREEHERASELGQENARNYIHHQMCEVELRAGDLAAFAILFEEKDPNELMSSMHGHHPRLEAVAAAVRGIPQAVDGLAQRAIEISWDLQRWDLLEAWRARGVAALAGGDPARAREELGRVWDYTEEHGIANPGAFPVAGDLLEAAHALDDDATFEGVLGRLRELSIAQEHPWGLASVARGEALQLSGAADDGAAAQRFELAVASYDRLGCRFDAARTLLAQGRAARRARRWGAARAALTAAGQRFDALGATGWAAQARALLDGLGGRKPAATGALTPSERRAAELAREGRSNKEIAAALFVSVHTVEVHLARAYAKLGIQSRAQLSRALLMAAGEP